MRKIIFLIIGMALLAAGCNKEIDDSMADSPRHLTVDLTVNFDGPETRVVKEGWESGDKIYMVFDDFFTDDSQEKVYYLTITYDGTSWSSEFSDEALEEYLLEHPSGKFAAAYTSEGDPVFEYDGSGFFKQIIVTNPTPGFVMHSEYSYTVENDILKANLNMVLSGLCVHFFIDGINEVDAGNYSLKNENIQSVYFSSFFYPVSEPYANYGLNTFGEDIPGSFYKEGVRFCGNLNNGVEGVETEYIIQVTDNKGTPEDASDDVTYTLSKTASLKQKDAIKLPALDSGKWTIEGAGPQAADPSGTGTQEDPFNVAAAIQAVENLTWTSNSDYEKVGPYYVKGKISRIDQKDGEDLTYTQSGSYSNATFYICDEGFESTEFYGYRVAYVGKKTYTSDKPDIKVGDEVVIYGELMNYRGSTPETVQGSSYLYSLNGTTDESNDEPPTGDFTSNLTWTTGSNAYSETAIVNETADVPVLKLGTSSKVGEATVTLPAGTTKVSFFGVS